MAYMSQERKKELAPKIKEILAKYGMKGTLGVRHHSTLVLNIKSGRLDIIGQYNEYVKRQNDLYAGSGRHPICTLEKGHMDINPYYYKDHFKGEVLDFLNELIPAMNVGNFDHSDIQTDYFHVGWYTDINIGSWDVPYNHTPAA